MSGCINNIFAYPVPRSTTHVFSSKKFSSMPYEPFIVTKVTTLSLPVTQCSEGNVMHFLFSLLRIKGLYMFRALLAHPQEALYKRQLVYCERVMSVGCTRIEVVLVSVSVEV
jgi:hypothetical protein